MPERARWIGTMWRCWLLCGVLLGISRHATGQDEGVARAEGQVLSGHLGGVNAADFTPDGQRVVTVSADETARLWIAASGESVQVFRGHQGPVYCLAISGDGRWLVTGAQDNTVRLWDLPQSKPLRWTAAHEGPATDLAVSPDGLTLASVSADRRLRLEALVGTLPLQYRAAHNASITHVAYRNDSGLLATADEAGRLLLWNPYLEQAQAQFGAHESAVTGLLFHPDNQQLITAGQDGLLKWWQPGPPPRTLPSQPAAIRALAWLANQPIAVTAGSDKLIRVYDTNSTQQLREISGATAPLGAVAVSPNSSLVSAGDELGDLRIWNFGDGSPLHRLGGHRGAVTSVLFQADNQRFTSIAADGLLRVWQLPARPLALAGHGQPALAVAYSPNGQFLVTGSSDQSLRVWDAAGQPLRAITGHAAAVTTVAIRGDSGQIASGDSAGNLLLTNPQDGSQQAQWGAHTAAINRVEYDPNDQSLLTAATDGMLKRWRLPAEPSRILSGHGQAVRDVACTPDGSLAVTASADQTVRLWQVSTGQAVRSLDGQIGPAYAVALSPDGNLVAAAGEAGVIQVWQVSDGAARWRLAGAEGAIRDLAFHPRGDSVAGVVADGTVRLWRLAAPAADGTLPNDPAVPTATISFPDAKATCVAFTPDRRSLVVGQDARRLVLWDLEMAAVRRTYTGPQDAVTAVAISSSGMHVAASSADKSVYVWELNKDAGSVEPARVITHPTAVRGVAFDAAARHLATIADDGVVRIWEPESGREWEQFAGHTAAGLAVAFAGERHIVSTAADNTARAWTLSAIAMTDASAITDFCCAGTDIVWIDGVSPRATAWDKGVPSSRIWGGASANLTLLDCDTAQRILVGADLQGSLYVWTLAENQPPRKCETGTPIRALALHPAGDQLAYADNVGRIHIIRLEDFLELENFDGPPQVAALAWSPDGKSLVAGTHEGTPWLYRPSLQRVVTAHAPGPAWATSWGSGEMIATAGSDGRVLLWNINTDQPPRVLAEGGSPATAAAVSSDGARVAVASAGQGVRVWALADGQSLASLALAEPVRALAFSPDGKRLATGGDDRRVRVYDTATWHLLEFFDGHTGPVAALQFTGDNRALLSAGADQTPRIWPLNATRVVHGHPGGIYSAALLSGGGQFVTAGADKRLVLWDTNSGQPARTFEGYGVPQTTLAVRPDNQRLATGGKDGVLHLWNLGSGAHLAEFPLGGEVLHVAFSPDNQKIVVADAAGGIQFLAAPTPMQAGVEYELQQRFVAESPALRLAFAADNRTVRASHASGHLSEWAYASPVPVRQFNHGGPVFSVVVNRDGTVIVSGSADQTVRVWDAKTGGQRAQLSGHQGAVYGLALNRDESLAVSSGNDNTLRLWDIQGGRQLKQLATTEATAYALAVHPVAPILVTGGADRRVHLYDLLTGDRQRTCVGHPDYIHSVVFDPQGARVLSYGYAGHLIVWKTDDGTKLFETRIGRVGNTARYSPDGSRVVLANGDGTARILELPAQAR